MLGRLITIMSRKPKQNGLEGFNVTSVYPPQNEIDIEDQDELIDSKIQLQSQNETENKSEFAKTLSITEENFREQQKHHLF